MYGILSLYAFDGKEDDTGCAYSKAWNFEISRFVGGVFIN